MAKSYEVEIDAHSSIYKKDYLENNYKERKLKVYFSTPDNEVNERTGILLLIPGFGGNANSNVYKKMRKEFADKYNLITIQCDYFGWEFMQSDYENLQIVGAIFNTNCQSIIDMYKSKIQGCRSLDEIINIDYRVDTKLTFNKLCNECIDNFCDMGIMQGLDNVLATLFVMNTIYSNDYIFNTNRVIIMGQSHGSYLAYLCNYLCQGLYTNILDNSSWVFPSYLNEDRFFYNQVKDNLLFEVKQSYYAKEENLKLKYLSLEKIYKDFFNECKIVVYHGADDDLISYNIKNDALKDINNVEINKVTSEHIGKGIFSSTSHGCGADFLELFNIYWKENIEINNKLNCELRYKNKSFILNGQCFIEYSNNIPVYFLR
ncbi:MAG: DUF2920 family protein [Clostridium sp.]|uniref:DUF2920 family protein n=1 Tax=Clostridium sp. TaxID=1506 RepID=UPI002FC9351F